MLTDVTFLNYIFPFLSLNEIVKISMTSRKNNKFISELINEHFINRNVFKVMPDNIMFIPKFVEYLYLFNNSSCMKHCEHLNKLVKQITLKDTTIYLFYRNPSILTYSARYFKLNNFARYMKFAMEHDPLLFQNGTKEFRYQDWWGRKALDADIRNYPYVSRSLRTNEYYAKRAVESNGLFLEHANKLRNNKEICLIAFEQNPESFKYVGNLLKNNTDFMKEI
jgi:hypothetical protein